jgi:hypothetical protein
VDLAGFSLLLRGAGRVPPAHTPRGGLSYVKCRRLSKRKREEKRESLSVHCQCAPAGLAPQPSRLFVRARPDRQSIRADRHASDSAGLALERRPARHIHTAFSPCNSQCRCKIFPVPDDFSTPVRNGMARKKGKNRATSAPGNSAASSDDALIEEAIARAQAEREEMQGARGRQSAPPKASASSCTAAVRSCSPVSCAAAQNESNVPSNPNIDAWWASATQGDPEDAYKRLIDACRLAVEDAYTVHGDAIGSYAEASGVGGAGMRFFDDFLRTASRQGLLPPWWTSADVTAVKKLGKDPKKSFCILHAQEVSDVTKTWGAATTWVLRLLARRVYDAIGYGEDEGEDDHEDESDYDDEDYCTDDSVDEADATMTHWCGLKYNHGIKEDSGPNYTEFGRRSLATLDLDAADERKQFQLRADATPEAKTLFREIASARTAKAEAAKEQGNAHVARKEWREASAQYSIARRIDPRNEIYHSNYSHACLELAKKDVPGECSKWSSEAVSAGWCCVHLKPTWAKGYSRLGAALAATGQPGLASQVYEDGARVARTDRSWWADRMEECDNMEAMLFYVCEELHDVILTEDSDRALALAEVASLAAGRIMPEAMLASEPSWRRCCAELLGRPNIFLARALQTPEHSMVWCKDGLTASDMPALVATLISIRCVVSAHACLRKRSAHFMPALLAGRM